MAQTNTRIVLASRPKGAVSEDNFRIEQQPVTAPGDGEVLVRHHYLSLDPYMRGRLNDARSYAEPQALDDVMVGGTVGEVVESRSPALSVGDFVTGMGGWQQFATVPAQALRKVDPALPLSVYLGPVGMPGITGWVGLTDIGQPKAGETVVVSSAAGAVGSVVGQLAKLRGCRAVGIAGGAEKCAYVVDELGFDACIDYKSSDVYAQLKAATPDGVDVYFENVGGAIFDMVMRRLNPFARIPLCGWISGYDTTDPAPVHTVSMLLTMRATITGFIVGERMERWPAAMQELGALVADGRLKYREHVTDGIENAPGAFLGLLRGANFGKQLVKLI